MDVEVIWVKSEPEYFCERGWTLICCFARRAQIQSALMRFLTQPSSPAHAGDPVNAAVRDAVHFRRARRYRVKRRQAFGIRIVATFTWGRKRICLCFRAGGPLYVRDHTFVG
jgi:hypothetical protein